MTQFKFKDDQWNVLTKDANFCVKIRFIIIKLMRFQECKKVDPKTFYVTCMLLTCYTCMFKILNFRFDAEIIILESILAFWDFFWESRTFGGLQGEAGFS